MAVLHTNDNRAELIGSIEKYLIVIITIIVPTIIFQYETISLIERTQSYFRL